MFSKHSWPKNVAIVHLFLFFISEHKLGVPLTVVRSFHSHLEPLRLIAESSMSDQISFGYAAPSSLQQSNHIALPSSSQLSELEDPTRFMSLHCYLFPGSLKMCPKHWIRKFWYHGWTPEQTILDSVFYKQCFEEAKWIIVDYCYLTEYNRITP